MSMKRNISINESQLKNIISETIMEVLNFERIEEAYATTPKADIDKFNNLDFGSTNGETLMADNRIDKTATQIDRVCKGISAVMKETYSQPGKYSKKIYELASKAYYIANMWKKQEMMKLGIQPDTNYDEKHKKTDYSFMSDPSYMESREKAYGA